MSVRTGLTRLSQPSRSLLPRTTPSSFSASPSSSSLAGLRLLSSSVAKRQTNPTTLHPPSGSPSNQAPPGGKNSHAGYIPPADENARANQGPHSHKVPAGENTTRPRESSGEGGYGQPPKGQYKAEGRRVTAAMIATPIALVTGYVLYDRVVAGNDKRALPGTGASGGRA